MVISLICPWEKDWSPGYLCPCKSSNHKYVPLSSKSNMAAIRQSRKVSSGVIYYVPCTIMKSPLSRRRRPESCKAERKTRLRSLRCGKCCNILTLSQLPAELCLKNKSSCIFMTFGEKKKKIWEVKKRWCLGLWFPRGAKHVSMPKSGQRCDWRLTG